MEGSAHKNHEDHIAGKGRNSLSHNNLVRKFIPLPQAMKTPDANGSGRQRMGKTREKTGMPDHESQKQKKEVIAEPRKAGNTVHFGSLMDICLLKNAELEANFQKYKKAELYSEVTL